MIAAKQTQAQRILQRLKAEGELTNVQLIDMRILRGAARIEELRKQGHRIESIKLKGGVWKYKYVERVHVRALEDYSMLPWKPDLVIESTTATGGPTQLGLDLGEIAPPARKVMI